LNSKGLSNLSFSQDFIFGYESVTQFRVKFERIVSIQYIHNTSQNGFTYGRCSYEKVFLQQKPGTGNIKGKSQKKLVRLRLRMVYYTITLSSFYCFYWTMGHFTAAYLSTPNFRKHDEIS
jgi:hypothetical protein